MPSVTPSMRRAQSNRHLLAALRKIRDGMSCDYNQGAQEALYDVAECLEQFMKIEMPTDFPETREEICTRLESRR